MNYTIKLDKFEGPLDLLLYLIKKDHIAICDIPIAHVTQQYVQYLELMQLLDLAVAGEFLVMAATLMQIKSKMLLPLPEQDEDAPEEQDPRAELVRRLLEYKKYKEAAGYLEQRESLQATMFRRSVAADRVEGEAEIKVATTVFDLLNAFARALQEAPREFFREIIDDEFTVEGKIHDLLHMLARQRRVSLQSIFAMARNKAEMIATFLAVLELVRQKEAFCAQDQVFGSIDIIVNQERLKPVAEQPALCGGD